MKKNTASQVIGAQMINASTGAAFTGSVTVYVTGDGGTQAVGSVGSGACTHKGNGYHTYAPAQAETNYDLVAFTFTGTGAVPVTVQVYTTFPQTGDNYARLGAPAGASIAADIATVDTVVDTINTNVGTAGAGLTNINLPDQTMNITGNITGNLSGSVGSVTGTVGGIAGTIQTLDALDTAQDTQHSTTQSAISALNDPTAAAIADAVWDELQSGHVTGGSFGEIATEIASILADTNELQTDWANGGRLDLIVDAILVDTAEIGAAGVGLTNLGGMSTTMKAQVNAEMVDVIATDTYAEPGQGAPAATASLAAKINYLYKNWRNKRTQTATTESLYDDAGTTVDQKRTVSDDGTTATKGEMSTGP